MERKNICLGSIDEVESKEIEPIVERISGLEELLLIVEDESLALKINEELTELNKYRLEWWQRIVKSHGWNVDTNINWSVDYKDNKIWIIS